MATDWLGNLFEGLKQGYMDSGGATPANVFSGPTPMAGDAPAGFAGGLGNFIGGLGGTVSDLALHTLPDFVKNPESFFNEKGELSLTRVAVPEYRRDKIKEAKSAEETKKALLIAKGITQANSVAEQALKYRTSEGANAYLQSLPAEAQDQARQAIAARDAEYAAGAAVNRESGMNPLASLFVDPSGSQSAALTRYGEQQTQQTNEKQGAITRQNQANQYDYDMKSLGARTSAERGTIDYRNEADIKKQQNLDQYNRFRAAGDASRAAAMVPTLPGMGVGEPGYEVGQAYIAAAQADPAGTLTAKLGEQIPAYYTPAQTASGYRTSLTDNLKDPDVMGKFTPAEQAYAVSGLRDEAAAKEVLGFIRGRLEETAKPTRINEAKLRRQEDVANAEALNATLAPLLKDGILKKTALSAKGERAIKVSDRVIAQLDMANADSNAVEALIAWRNSSVGQKAKPETLAKVDASIGAGGEVAKQTFGQLPIVPPRGAKDAKAVDINSAPIVKVTDAIREATDSLSTVDRAVMAAGEVTADGKIRINPSLFGATSGQIATMAANYGLTGLIPGLGFSDAQLNAKNELVSYASNSLSSYQRSISGLTVGDKESERIQSFWITGYEASPELFMKKVEVIRDLVGQQQYWRGQEYKARIANDPVALEKAVLRQQQAVSNAGVKLESITKAPGTPEEVAAYNALPPEDQ